MALWVIFGWLLGAAPRGGHEPAAGPRVTPPPRRPAGGSEAEYIEGAGDPPRPNGIDRGVGGALTGHLAAAAIENRCGRFEWTGPDWNRPAIGFYRKLGAKVLDDWRVCRLTAGQLAAVAGRTGTGSDGR